MTEKGFWDGVRAATPTVFGYLSIGLAFGIVAAKSGVSPLETGLMSLLVYSGSGQFGRTGPYRDLYDRRELWGAFGGTYPPQGNLAGLDVWQ